MSNKTKHTPSNKQEEIGIHNDCQWPPTESLCPKEPSKGAGEKKNKNPHVIRGMIMFALTEKLTHKNRQAFEASSGWAYIKPKSIPSPQKAFCQQPRVCVLHT